MNKNEESPYTELIIRIGVATIQCYCTLNLCTDVFSYIPDFKMDRLETVYLIMPFNFIGLLLFFVRNRTNFLALSKSSMFTKSTLNMLNRISRNIALFSGFLVAASSTFLYCSEYREILIMKAELLFFIYFAPMALLLLILYLYYKQKLK